MTPESELAITQALSLLESQIMKARDRQYCLQRESEIALVKCQVVGEWRVEMENTRDKLRSMITPANASDQRPATKTP